MAGEPTITVIGNLTADPDLRYTPNGAAVANIVIASTPRYFDRQANEWKDGETLFVRGSVWREMAENLTESATKGSRVIAEGLVKAKSFQDKEGNQRTSWELDITEIGVSLRFATASMSRSGQGTGGGAGAGAGSGFGAPAQQQSSAQTVGADGWPVAY